MREGISNTMKNMQLGLSVVLGTIGLLMMNWMVGSDSPIKYTVSDISMSARERVEVCMQVFPKPARSLVLVVHGGKTGYDYVAEWSNLNYFLRNGVDTSRADYVFILPDPSAEPWPDHMQAMHNGVSMVFMSTAEKAPCDLCAHAMVIKSIGVEQIIRDYGMVVMMNTGTRGEVFLL